ncbi:MAG: AAA family ATPase, partial [Pseudomonadales bacterium]|nr:AAA family ATPase [Pseudomonadales bacterium]
MKISEVNELKIGDLLSLPVIPLKEGILFPGVETPLSFGRAISINGASMASKSNNLAVVVSQKKSDKENPTPDDLYNVGVLVKLDKIFNLETGANCVVKAISRVKVLNYVKIKPAFFANVIVIHDEIRDEAETKLLANHVQNSFKDLIQLGKPVEFTNFIRLLNGASEGQIADYIANTLNVNTKTKQKILETFEVGKRIKLILSEIEMEKQVLGIEKDVISKTQEKFDRTMRENILRERLHMIQKELGDVDDDEEVADEYSGKLKKLPVSDEVKTKITKELNRFRQMSMGSPEVSYMRNWLDTVFDLPWGKYSPDTLKIEKAAQILDQSHYGLKEVKDRVLEAIAVLQLKQKAKKDSNLPTILCFVGPPGVGKTSIGKSIAKALGRKFTKISLGGVKDEAEIRGHRRTYVGAMPGRIINGIKQAGTNNPVFMLDEIDKLANDYRGDPTSALLEVLDPAQNNAFEDHYLDMPYDLSKVIFIATANSLDIPPALRDRLEIIEYTGYTTKEKIQIAREHLYAKNLKANGLKKSQLKISDEMYQEIIESYTREAGVRGLERQLSKIMRKVAREILEQPKVKEIVLDGKKLVQYLGSKEYDITSQNKNDEV